MSHGDVDASLFFVIRVSGAGGAPIHRPGQARSPQEAARGEPAGVPSCSAVSFVQGFQMFKDTNLPRKLSPRFPCSSRQVRYPVCAQSLYRDSSATFACYELVPSCSEPSHRCSPAQQSCQLKQSRAHTAVGISRLPLLLWACWRGFRKRIRHGYRVLHPCFGGC